MKTFVRRLALLLALPLTGCLHYASWEKFSRAPAYTAPKKLPLVVFRSDAVRQQDEGGFVETTALVVQEDLREHGIEAEIVDAPTKADALPRIELEFQRWSEGSSVLRWASNGLGGHASLLLDMRVLGADGKIALEGRVSGEHADTGGDVRDAAEAAGHSIAKAVMDPTFDPKPAADVRNSPP